MMPWIVKGLFILAKTRRGRQLLLAAGVGVVELAKSDQARRLYESARTKVIDPAVSRTRMRT